MNTKIILAIVGIAIVSAALVGLTAAQLASQTPTATVGPSGQVLPPCVIGSNGVVPSYCINATTGEPYCYNNGAYAGYCNGYGYDQSGQGYGYGCSGQNQFQFGAGMMGQRGNGFGCR